MALALAGGSAEMEGVQFLSAATIGDRFQVSLGDKIGDGPLIPRLGQMAVFLNQPCGSSSGGIVLFGRVQSNDAGQLLLLAPVAIAAPDGTNGRFGKRAHATIAVQQCMA